MRVVFDADVILDLLLDRQPFVREAADLLSRAERGEIAGFICATGVTVLHYIARKTVGTDQAKVQIGRLLSFLDVAAVGRSVIEEALSSRMSDFEDAVVAASARVVSANAIVTRNLEDYKHSTVPAFSPGELVAALDSSASRLPPETS